MTQRDSDHRPSSRRRLAAGAGASAAALLAAPSAAQAVDYEVNNTGDAAGFCSETACSLRQAINTANQIGGTDDLITFHSSVTGTITLGSSLPPIEYDGSLDILGPGAQTLAVSGAGSHRIFEIEDTSGPVTISGLTLRDGDAGNSSGGAIFNDGAVLTLRNSIVTGNDAARGGGVGAFAGNPTTTIEGSTISDNFASSDGGGVGVVGGSGATLTIRRSTISRNYAADVGGGVSGFGATTTIEVSTITGNEAAHNGGGVYTYAIPDATLTSTIVAGNTAADTGPDLSEDQFQSSFSLIGDTSDADIVNLGGSILNQPAQLGPLAFNGGPTPTHAPALTSPAIDAGRAAGPDQRGFARPVNQPTIPVAAGSNAADIGAVELAAVPVALPSNAFSFGKLKRKKRKGVARLRVLVPFAGEVALFGKKVKNRSRQAAGPGVVVVPVKARGKKRKRLKRKGRAKVGFRVSFTPHLGLTNTKHRKVKLVKK